MNYTLCLNYGTHSIKTNEIITGVLCKGYPVEGQTLIYDNKEFKVEEVKRFLMSTKKGNKLEESVRVDVREKEK